MSCGVGRRRGLDPALLWLWRRPVAAALVGPLAWEPPYAVGVALKRPKKFLVFFFLMLFRAAPTAYGGSQARGLIRPVAPSLQPQQRGI